MSEIKNREKSPTFYTLIELRPKSVKKLRHLAKTDKIKLLGAKKKTEILKIMSEYYSKAKKDYLNMPDTPDISRIKKMYTWEELESKNMKQLKDLANIYQVNLSEAKKKVEIIKIIHEKVNKIYTWEELESKSWRQLLDIARIDRIKLSGARTKAKIVKIIWRYYEKVKEFYFDPPKEKQIYTQEELQSLTVKHLRRLAKVKKLKLSRAAKKEDIIMVISAYYLKIEARETIEPLPNQIIVRLNSDGNDDYFVCPKLEKKWWAEWRAKEYEKAYVPRIKKMMDLLKKQNNLCAQCGKSLLPEDKTKDPKICTRNQYNKHRDPTHEIEIVHEHCKEYYTYPPRIPQIFQFL